MTKENEENTEDTHVSQSRVELSCCEFKLLFTLSQLNTSSKYTAKSQ